MPKVSDAHRHARRDEIARATLRCMRRQGLSGTTMADIIDESGLSAGAIYGNFSNKAELIRHVAAQVLDGRAHRIDAFTAADGPGHPSPAQIVELALTSLIDDDVPFEVFVQFWAESSVDAEIRSTVQEFTGQLEQVFVRAIRPWCDQRGTDRADRASAEALAPVMIAICHGFIVRAAVSGDLDPPTYVAGARTLLAD
ncbi:TetR/AcrR family transcriptional regulator [Aeromicrobium chenweiae]|uniref:Uncharacterized protein n=1 Tax=Aeromicrobium chenweiae TaxID=2079793 RepID=A0A2S0WP15_9ACTN|nr:TetR/AcrR family transcriptional regulator [Aeromicrobium chenweiae]AWB93057.1 hypothetical protein C3E78_13040 [Aeromicrobium chenweiae]TGN34046.1 TetR/AcrR family transcriptional regulator [Aeromicrobium chenweiae]